MRYLLRYISILFFIFLSLHSYFVFAQQEPPKPTCNGRSVQSACTDMSKITGSSLTYFNNLCYNGQPGKHQAFETNPSCTGAATTSIVCYSQCTCTPPYVFNTTLNTATGLYESGCILPASDPGDECTNGTDPETGLCNSEDLCPSGYPKVNGQCPVCPTGYNDDGSCSYPSSEPSNSSSPNSASAGSNASAASTPSGDGDDGGDGTSGGGGSGGGSGGNNAGGSAASASSASGTVTSSGTNNSWNPYSGYGNWIPIAPDSPCPNKYQDVSGQWWCAGNGIGSGSASSAGSNGSNGSNSSGSAGSNSSGSSASSSCPAKPQCKKNTGIEADDNACKKLLQEYFSACPGNPTENGLFDIDKDELGEGRPLTFKNSLEDFKTSMTDSENVQAINEFFSFEGSGTCPVWQVQAMGFNIVIDQQCSPNIPWDLIRGMIIAVSILLAARIALH